MIQNRCASRTHIYAAPVAFGRRAAANGIAVLIIRQAGKDDRVISRGTDCQCAVDTDIIRITISFDHFISAQLPHSPGRYLDTCLKYPLQGIGSAQLDVTL